MPALLVQKPLEGRGGVSRHTASTASVPDDVRVMHELEGKIAAQRAGRHVGVFGIPAPPNDLWLAGTVPDELAEFFRKLTAPFLEQLEGAGPRMGLPEIGQNLAKTLAHYWDSDGHPSVEGESRVLNMAGDPDPNLQAGYLAAAGVELRAVSHTIDVDGRRVCVVDFDVEGSLPPLSRQLIDRVMRQGPFGGFRGDSSRAGRRRPRE